MWFGLSYSSSRQVSFGFGQYVVSTYAMSAGQGPLAAAASTSGATPPSLALMLGGPEDTIGIGGAASAGRELGGRSGGGAISPPHAAIATAVAKSALPR